MNLCFHGGCYCLICNAWTLPSSPVSFTTLLKSEVSNIEPQGQNGPSKDTSLVSWMANMKGAKIQDILLGCVVKPLYSKFHCSTYCKYSFRKTMFSERILWICVSLSFQLTSQRQINGGIANSYNKCLRCPFITHETKRNKVWIIAHIKQVLKSAHKIVQS